ncbi:MAG: nicotinate phosphoribosyltransferase [Clostridia bacterium]
MGIQHKANLTMLMDFYELTMSKGYLDHGLESRIAYFDMFFRNVPDSGGYAIMAGVEQLMDYLKNLRFSDDDVEFLRTKGVFNDAFLEYLRRFEFTCDVWAIKEGMPIFPGEPIVTVRGPAIEAQLVETMLLLTINHQSLIATKTSRIVRAAQGRPVMEFGSRRAQGYDGAIMGARAAYIGGCVGTACTICERDFGIPALGTMAHSWVQMFDSELDAFRAYARSWPENCSLLVDTYNVLKSGIPHAIQVFNEEILPRGLRPGSIRIDSGDITYLSQKAREMLDAAGFTDCKIIISNALDEYIIRDLIMQGAQIDSFGVGERLITSRSEPVFGGVYKLAAVERNGEITPKIKISENVEKITTPGFKQVWRLFDNESGKAMADVITLRDEEIVSGEPYELFDPEFSWKRKKISNFTAKPLLMPIFEKGKCVYECPPIKEVREFCAQSLDTLWSEVMRFEKPHKYYVDMSQKLWSMREKLLENV